MAADIAQSIRYPPLPPELQGRMGWRVLRHFGAGAIIASVTIGSGETLFASRGGAIFGYALLWCFIGGALMKGVQVYTAARYMTLTGEHPMQRWGDLPGPRNWVPLLIGTLSLLCFPFWLSALPRILGEAVNWIFHVADSDDPAFDLLARVWGTAAIVLAITLTWLQTYGVLEKVQTVVVAVLLSSVMAACIAARPDWLLALAGAVTPSIPRYEDWLISGYPKLSSTPPWVEVGLYLGAIGGGTYDYIGYLGCLREKRWGAIGVDGSTRSGPREAVKIATDAENAALGRRWLRPAKVDVGISFLCVLIFTTCFLLLGAAVLHPEHRVPDGRELLTHQATFLTRLHPSLLYVYQVGIFMAFWGTIYGAYELYCRTTYECLAPLSARFRALPYARVRLGVLVYTGVGGLVLLWSFQNPVEWVKPAALVGGVLTCGLWCFAMIWTDRRFLPASLQMGKLLILATGVSGAVLTILGLKGLWDYIGALVK